MSGKSLRLDTWRLERSQEPLERLVRNHHPFPSQVEDIPDYAAWIAHPMDFGTMRKKLVDGAAPLERGDAYLPEDLCADFDLVVANCLYFNGKGSWLYGYASAIKRKGLGAKVYWARRLARALLRALAALDDQLIFAAPVSVEDQGGNRGLHCHFNL